MLYLLYALRGIYMEAQRIVDGKGDMLASTAVGAVAEGGVHPCIPTAWSPSRRACLDLAYACDTAGSDCGYSHWRIKLLVPALHLPANKSPLCNKA